MRLIPILLFSLFFPLSAASFYQQAVLKKTTVAKVSAKLKQKLEKSGEIRLLKFSDVVKSQGTDFPEYHILLSCMGKKFNAVVIADPALANLLPCSIAIYDSGKGNVTVNIANPASFADSAGISAAGKKTAMQEYARLKKSLGLVFKAVGKDASGNIFRQTDVASSSLEDYNTMLVSSLQGENLNVVFTSSDKTSLAIHYVCSATIGNAILKKMPQFGVFAPCRLVVVKTDTGFRSGFLDITEIVKSYETEIGKDGMDAALKLNAAVVSALELAGN